MSVKKTVLISVSLLAVGACSTTQESPIYQQSTKYKVHSPYEQAQQPAPVQYANYPSTVTTQPTTQYATYTTNSTPQVYHTSTTSTGQTVSTQVNHECLDKEGNRKIIGAAAGGAVGALAGNHVGDTTGAVIGAVVGGAAGYGIADVTTNCDPIEVAAPATHQTYQTVPATQTYTSQSYPSQTYTGETHTAQTYPAQSYSTTTGTAPAPANHQVSGTIEAPTDSAYGETYGTPGYHAMIANGELDETTTASVSTPEQPAVTPYSQPAPIPQPIPQAAPQPQTNSYAYQSAPTYPQYSQPAPQQPVTQYAGNVTTHQVVEGDTVYSLSRRLCVDVEDIRRLNNLNGAFYIRLDDYIKLPASRC